MTDDLSQFTAGKRQVLALALRIPDDEVIRPGDNDASRHDVISLEYDGWLVFRDDLAERGWQASPELREAPFAQELIDNPFGEAN